MALEKLSTLNGRFSGDGVKENEKRKTFNPHLAGQ
jgi:hypothetical protein